MVKTADRQAMATGKTFGSRFAAWLGDRLPRVEASDRIDWFFVWLVAGPCLTAVIVMALYGMDHVCHTSFLPSSVQPRRTLKGYAVAHVQADRLLQIVGLVAAAYPTLLWIVVRITTCGRLGRPRVKPRSIW